MRVLYPLTLLHFDQLPKLNKLEVSSKLSENKYSQNKNCFPLKMKYANISMLKLASNFLLSINFDVTILPTSASQISVFFFF